MKTNHYCPECGYKFQQGDANYNYDSANLDYECPKCGWTGTQDGVLDTEI